MNRETFKKGLAVLSMVGMGELDNYQLKTWWELLNDIDDKLFLDSVKRLCKETEKFYPGDNIPGTIRATGKRMIQERIMLDKKNKKDQKLLAEKKADKDAVDSWGTVEQRLKAVREAKKLAGQIGRVF